MECQTVRTQTDKKAQVTVQKLKFPDFRWRNHGPSPWPLRNRKTNEWTQRTTHHLHQHHVFLSPRETRHTFFSLTYRTTLGRDHSLCYPGAPMQLRHRSHFTRILHFGLQGWVVTKSQSGWSVWRNQAPTRVLVPCLWCWWTWSCLLDVETLSFFPHEDRSTPDET